MRDEEDWDRVSTKKEVPMSRRVRAGALVSSLREGFWGVRSEKLEKTKLSQCHFISLQPYRVHMRDKVKILIRKTASVHSECLKNGL